MIKLSKQIEMFSPAQGNWLELDRMISGIENISEEIICACLGLFERYPDEDDAGVFFSIVHTLEYFGGYEHALATSVLKNPNEWNLLMLGRMQNAGINTVGSYTINEIFMNVRNNSALSPELRGSVQEYLN